MLWPMAEALRIASGTEIPLSEIRLHTSRSSGPGGQHANVTESRVEATFEIASSAALSDAQKERLISRLGPVVRAVSQDARSQLRNRDLALERLEQRLADALVEERPRIKTRPGRGAEQRRLEAKKARSNVKRARRKPDTD